MAPAGVYNVYVTQNGVRSNVGSLTFPVVPTIITIDPCNSQPTACTTGASVTITGQHFNLVSGNTVTLSGNANGLATPTCIVGSATATQIICTLTVPVGATGQWITGVGVASTTTGAVVPATCTDPQLCLVFLQAAAPTITNVASPVCNVITQGPTAQLTDCSQGQLTIQGTNFFPGNPNLNSVVFTAVPGSGAGPAPTCVTRTVSSAGTSLVCDLDVSQLTTGQWAVQVDVLGQRTTVFPNAPTVAVAAGNRNPTVGSPPGDVLVCEDSGQYFVPGFLTNIQDGNQNLQTLSCSITPVTPLNSTTAFSTGPDCVIRRGAGSSTADLVFTSAPNYYGTLYYDVQIQDDGVAGPCAPAPCTPCAPVATCQNSQTYTFALTILPVNDMPTFTCGGDIAVQEDAGRQVFGTFFGNVTRGGVLEDQQILSFALRTTNDALFAVVPRVTYVAGSSTAQLDFTAADNACGEATVTVDLNDDNNNLNAYFQNQIALTPYVHTRGTSFVRNGVTVNSCTHQNSAQPCTFRILIRCIDDPPNFLMGPSPITVNEDDPLFFHSRWASNISVDNTAVSFRAYLVDPFHSELFSVQPSLSGAGDLTFKTAKDAHSVQRTVLVGIQATDGLGVSSCDVFVVCPMPTCCPELEIIINPINDPPFFTPGPIIEVDEDSGALTFTEWASPVRVGPENEGTSSIIFEQQVPEFFVTAADASLFEFQPALTPTLQCQAVNMLGTVCQASLTFTPAADEFGFTKVEVILKDTGPALARDGTVPPPGLDGSNEALPEFFTIRINPVNDAPTFNPLPTAVLVAEDSGPFFFENWLGGVTAGPTNEAGQFLKFTLSAAEPSLFSVQPEMVLSGTNMASLSFTPADNMVGSTTVSVVLTDDGGTANGGVAQKTSSFTIVIEAVNDAPSFEIGPDITVLEDSGPLGGHTFPNWAKNLNPGGGVDEDLQNLEFELIAQTGLTEIFDGNPTVSAEGVLSFNTRPDAFGVSTVSIKLSDNGAPPQSSEIQTFTISVLPVNDAPTFTPGPHLAFDECQSIQPTDPCPAVWVNWATDISPGPDNERNQNLRFEVNTQIQPEIFAEMPKIDNETGTLTMLLNPRLNRDTVLPLEVTLIDDGGVANGGRDSSTQTLQLLVNPINSPPFFVAGPTLVLPEDTPTHHHPAWATNISAGGLDEAMQTLTFLASTNPPNVFTDGPAINPLSGDLTFTVAPDFNGLVDVTFTLTDGEKEFRLSSMWQFTPVNDPPIFTPGPGVITVLENSGPQVKQWVTTPASPGPPDEQDQEWFYRITVETPNLFISPPVLFNNGTLFFETTPHYSGDAIIYIVAEDNGPAPGVNQSNPVQLIIRILPVNSDPSFAVGRDVSVWEDYGLMTVLGWATEITPGPGEEVLTQTLTFRLKAQNPALFAVQPAVDPVSGDLNFTTAPDEYGDTDVTAVLLDNDGATSAVFVFNINITAVNDRPFFVAGPTLSLIEDTMEVEFPAWATQRSAGPRNERHQSFNFTVTTSKPALFEIQPSIDPNTGTLTWKLAADKNGRAEGEVCMKDNGGVAVPGRDFDTTCLPIVFDVTSINDPPRITRDRLIEVNEDAGAVTVQAWAISLVPGPTDEVLEGQMLESIEIRISDRNGNAARTETLFDTLPSLSKLNGNIYFHTALDQSGTADFEIILRDTLGAVSYEDFSITIHPVNDPPDFTALAEVITVQEDSGPYRMIFAEDIGAGRRDEVGQTVAFEVQVMPVSFVAGTATQPVQWNLTSELFSQQPAISPNGILTFTPAENLYGTAKFRIQARDSGGTERGGDDDTDYSYLTINIVPVNDPPYFRTDLWEIRIQEDSGRQVIPNWATDLMKGPPNEAAQNLVFHVEVLGLYQNSRLVPNTDAASLFVEFPWVDIVGNTGQLVYHVKDNVWGEIRARVTLSDSEGGNSTQTQDLVIIVNAVNDLPRFFAPPAVDVPEDSGIVVVPNFVSGADSGPFEREETLTYRVIIPAADAWLFKVPPQILYPSGDLTFETNPDVFGTSVARLEVQDEWDPPGLASQEIIINITPVNDRPCLAVGDVVVVPEDAPLFERKLWMKNLNCAGPANEEPYQTVRYEVYNDTALSYFLVPPTISPEGTLSFQARPEVSGSFVFQVIARDDGGVVNGGIDFSAPQTLIIQVTENNDVPFYTPGPTRLSVTTTDRVYSEQWATEIHGGPIVGGEASQLVDFVVTVSNPGLFTQAGQPSVTPKGVLSFIGSGLIGSSSLTIAARDSLGLTSTPIVVTVTVDGHGKRVFVLALVPGHPIQDATAFRNKIAKLLSGALPDQVTIQTLSGTEPEGRVEMTLENRDLETAFIVLAQSAVGMQQLRDELSIETVSLKQGVSGGDTDISAQLPPPAGYQNYKGEATGSSGLTTAEIVGVVIGVLCGVVLITAGILFGLRFHRRRKRRQNDIDAINSAVRDDDTVILQSRSNPNLYNAGNDRESGASQTISGEGFHAEERADLSLQSTTQTTLNPLASHEEEEGNTETKPKPTQILANPIDSTFASSSSRPGAKKSSSSSSRGGGGGGGGGEGERTSSSQGGLTASSASSGISHPDVPLLGKGVGVGVEVQIQRSRNRVNSNLAFDPDMSPEMRRVSGGSEPFGEGGEGEGEAGVEVFVEEEEVEVEVGDVMQTYQMSPEREREETAFDTVVVMP